MSRHRLLRGLLRSRSKWFELPRDLLELILEKLDLCDHARFASVCSSWRSAAVENPPINKPLHLALSRDPKGLVGRFITSLVPAWKSARFVGALDAWLAILINERDLFLLNKGSNSIISLPTPPLPPPPPQDPMDSYKRPEKWKVVLSSPPSSSSSVECIVAIQHYFYGVFYCRLGSDKSFTRLRINQIRPRDILFYEGRLYVICLYPETVAIRIFDHLLDKKVSPSSFKVPVPFLGPNFPFRLLISRNRLLAVTERPTRNVVLMFDEKYENGTRLVLLADIGDNLRLLLNYYCSLSIPSTKGTKYFCDESSVTFVLDTTKDRVLDTTKDRVLDTTKDRNKAKNLKDPCPLFFVMFRDDGFNNSVCHKRHSLVCW